MFAVLLARNAPKCRKAHAQMERLAALQERTSSVKSVIVPSLKALNCALSAKSFHVKPPSKDP